MPKIRIWKTTKRVYVTRYHHSEDLEGEGIVTDVSDDWFHNLKTVHPRSGTDIYQNMLNHQYHGSLGKAINE